MVTTQARLQRSTPMSAVAPIAGFIALLSLSVIFDPARLRVPWPVSFAAFCAAVAGTALHATRPGALLIAGCGWLDYNGFVADVGGTLHWHGGMDAIRLLLLLGCALVSVLVRRKVGARQ